MTISAVTHTPLPQVFKMTLGQVVRYASRLPDIVSLTNPFAGGGSDRPAPANGERVITDPREIRMVASVLGVKARMPT